MTKVKKIESLVNQLIEAIVICVFLRSIRFILWTNATWCFFLSIRQPNDFTRIKWPNHTQSIVPVWLPTNRNCPPRYVWIGLIQFHGFPSSISHFFPIVHLSWSFYLNCDVWHTQFCCWKNNSDIICHICERTCYFLSAFAQDKSIFCHLIHVILTIIQMQDQIRWTALAVIGWQRRGWDCIRQKRRRWQCWQMPNAISRNGGGNDGDDDAAAGSIPENISRL